MLFEYKLVRYSGTPYMFDTVTIRIPDKSSIQMVQTCPVVKWSSFQMVVWKPNQKCLFYCLNYLLFFETAPELDSSLRYLNYLAPFWSEFKATAWIPDKCLDFRLLKRNPCHTIIQKLVTKMFVIQMNPNFRCLIIKFRRIRVPTRHLSMRQKLKFYEISRFEVES